MPKRTNAAARVNIGWPCLRTLPVALLGAFCVVAPTQSVAVEGGDWCLLFGDAGYSCGDRATARDLSDFLL